MNECIFCKIAKKEASADVLYEDERVLVFKDIHPKAPVHLLVVSRSHIPSVLDLEAGHRDVIAHIIYTAKSVAEKYGLKGYKLVFNVGREGGQVVDHLHLHLLGGWTAPPE